MKKKKKRFTGHGVRGADKEGDSTGVLRLRSLNGEHSKRVAITP